MTDLPAAAITAAADGYRDYLADCGYGRPVGASLGRHEAALHAALERAAPHLAAAATTAERQRCAQLAAAHNATASKCAAGICIRPRCPCATANPKFPFADLLREDTP